jgi:hypothetical protein
MDPESHGVQRGLHVLWGKELRWPEAAADLPGKCLGTHLLTGTGELSRMQERAARWRPILLRRGDFARAPEH